MTHPVYSQTTLEAMTVAELKTIANQLGAIPDGDKRSKQTWVSAVLDHQIQFSPAKVAAMEAHIETVMTRMESVTPDASELPTVDTYIPTPRTHSDDVAFAAAMGLTYDDVFGEPLSAVDEDMGDIPALEPLTTPGKKATVYTQVSLESKRPPKVKAQMDNPILIHANLIDSQAFGDPRLVKRGRHYMRQSANIKP